MEYDLIIIGAGPGGLTAGIYASRRNLKTIILEGGVIGGQMALATEIENYPGVDRISGMELAKRMADQARKFGCEIKMEQVKDIDLQKKTVSTDTGSYSATAIILATGAGHKKLGMENEDKFVGRGVSYCATCDAPLFKGKRVAVVGGSDSAIMAALYLAEHASEVSLIHRRGELRAEETNQEKLKESKVKLILNAIITKVEGSSKVERITLEKEGKTEEMPIDGIFVYVGVVPTTALAKKAGVKQDELGYIETDKNKETNIQGVFAIGDSTGGIWQIAQAVGDGAVAAMSAYKYIKK
jgi:thioredoxin reductase (NADPH)